MRTSEVIANIEAAADGMREAELEENRRLIRKQGYAAVLVRGKVVYCETVEELEAALDGKIPSGAVKRHGRKGAH